ncbi:MAG: tRNA (adenosine(37)-N6)-dimethylallyltransferase MiaA [Candidatus Omnitrophota bacterium]
MKPKLIFIVGPTAVGKTDIAFILAKILKTEIVSCDAMQVYKEFSLLTARPSSKILKAIKHHLVGVVSVKENCDVFSFRKRVLSIIAGMERKKKIPLIVGGSGLYMSILLDGIFKEEQGGRHLAIRKKIEEEISRLGAEVVYERLKAVDPLSAAKIHVHDTRRMIRALEVFEIYGKPISELHRERQGLWESHDVKVFALSMKREDLYARINHRVDTIFDQGVVQEVKKIQNKEISQTASGIIGLKEIQLFLDGVLTQEQVKEEIKKNTRHYAKRQLTWFRKDKRLTWIDRGPSEDSREIAERILKYTGEEHV